MLRSILWWYFILFAATAYFAYNTVPHTFPYRNYLEYFFDSGAYYVVDLPGFGQVPNPKLRFYCTLFTFSALFIVLCLVEALLYCCSDNSPGTSGTTSIASPYYIRTDVYATIKNATEGNNPISSQILQVTASSVQAVHPSHYENKSKE